MLKAEQELLVQNTNQQLLSIRQAELDYFTSVFDTYAFQAALVAGSVANGFEQVLTQPANIPRWLKSGYWISAAFAMAFSIHCLSCTSFLSIYGPGFAMRGPVGSMTKAVRGMIEEHHQVFVSYILTIASFGVNILFCVWSIMYQDEAWACTVLVVIAFYFWYKYCIRAYNRFGDWDTDHVEEGLNDGQEQVIGEDGQVYSTKRQGQGNQGQEQGKNRHVRYSMDTDDSDSGRYERSKSRGEIPPEPPENPFTMERDRERAREHRDQFKDIDVIHNVAGGAGSAISTYKHGHRRKHHKTGEPQQAAEPVESSSIFDFIFRRRRSTKMAWPTRSEDVQELPENEELKMEGYLTLGEQPISSSWVDGNINEIQFKSWERYYFVLRDNCLWYYKSRQHYQDDSKHPVKNRPIKIDHYNPKQVSNSKGSTSNFLSSDENASIPMIVLEARSNNNIDSATGKQKEFVQQEVSLRHNDHELRPWGLRSDTREDLDLWIMFLEKASVFGMDGPAGANAIRRPSAYISQHEGRNSY